MGENAIQPASQPPDAQPQYRTLSNGALFDETRGRIVKGPTQPPINRENAAAMRQRRFELTRQKLAQAIVDKSVEKGVISPHAGPASAIAAAGAILYNDIVLSPDAPARERRETWLAIGKHAGLLADQREKPGTGDGVTLQIDSETAANLLQKLLENRQNG